MDTGALTLDPAAAAIAEAVPGAITEVCPAASFLVERFVASTPASVSRAAPAMAAAALPPSEAYTFTPWRASSSDAATPLRPSPMTAASPVFHPTGIIAA